MSEDDDGTEHSDESAFSFVDEAVSATDEEPDETPSATTDEEPDETPSATTDEDSDETPSATSDNRGETTADPTRTPSESAADAPLSDLAREVTRRREEQTQARDAGTDSDPFEEMDVGDVDTESIWEDLSESGGTETPPGSVAGSGAAVSDVDTDLPEHVVPKRKYCQRCRYFSDPPTAACTHEGTEIVELTDSEHFRVRACPMVGQEGPEFE